MVVYKEGTHLVFKRIDAVRYLSNEQIEQLASIVNTINQGRAAEGKKENKYLICNQDEPYANSVLTVILEGEQEKQEETYGGEIEIEVHDTKS